MPDMNNKRGGAQVTSPADKQDMPHMIDMPDMQDPRNISGVPVYVRNPVRSRMPVSQRAKQFAPFKSLGGDLDIALKQAEEEHRLETETKNVIHVELENNGDTP